MKQLDGVKAMIKVHQPVQVLQLLKYFHCLIPLITVIISFLSFQQFHFIHERKEIYWNERKQFIAEVNEVNDGVKWMGYSFRYLFTSFTLILLLS